MQKRNGSREAVGKFGRVVVAERGCSAVEAILRKNGRRITREKNRVAKIIFALRLSSVFSEVSIHERLP